MQQQAVVLAEIKKEKALFHQAVEGVPAPLFITDPAGCIQYSNQAAQRESGYTEDELLGQPASLLLPETPAEQQRLQAKKKDGTEYPATVTMSDLHDRQGDLLGTLFILKDLSVGQQAEKEQAGAKKKLTERLQKARRLETIGLIAGEVAHDLNNILASILHYPEQILRALPETSPLRPPLISLSRSGRQAVVLVTDLLSAAKAGSAVKEITDLNTLTGNTLAEKENQDFFTGQPGISLHTRLCPEPLFVSCSPSHIRQCLHNLLLNGCESIKAGDRVGTITVSVDSRYLPVLPPTAPPVSLPGEYAILSVADTGPSMSPADRARIFEPFYSKKILKRGGSGIALAVLRNIMEEHDGWIELPMESEADVGSTGQTSRPSNRFDLYFPLRPVQHISSGRESSNSNKELPGQGQRLLFIEKDKEQQERAIEFLTTIGYKAMAVTDSTGALSYLNRNRVDLVILDLVADQRMEGVELYEQLCFLHPSQKALIICASSEDRSVKEIQQRGEVELLRAPFTQEQLQEAVAKGLSPPLRTQG